MTTSGRVIIGAGDQRWDGWTPTQRDQLDLLDPESFENYFGTDRALAFLCEHVWEHLTSEQGMAAALLCFFRYLEPGGRVRVAVPDGWFPNEEYQAMVRVGGPGPADHPAADHRVVYKAETFRGVFTTAGFEVTLLEWWDSRGEFHAVPWSIEDGPIYRSSQLDHRNQQYRAGLGPPGSASIILDAVKPGSPNASDRWGGASRRA
jgi:predicted SAM-dependent methyltransferase